MCFTFRVKDSVGLRELRQQAPELVRRAETGEEIVVTVAGRPAAVIGPVRRERWRSGNDVAFLADPTDPSWVAEREGSPGIDDAPHDPWADIS